MSEVIQVGSVVKIFFRGGLSAQGTIVEWSETSLLLKAENCEDLLLINNPKEDILMIRIFASKQDKPQQNVSEQPKTNRSEFQPEQNLDIKSRSLKLVDLKLKQAEQERKIVSEKMKSFEPNPDTKSIEYGQPKFVKQYSGKKASRSALSNIERMREVQRKNQIRRGLRKV
jgi:hypothetical protein